MMIREQYCQKIKPKQYNIVLILISDKIFFVTISMHMSPFYNLANETFVYSLMLMTWDGQLSP